MFKLHRTGSFWGPRNTAVNISIPLLDFLSGQRFHKMGCAPWSQFFHILDTSEREWTQYKCTYIIQAIVANTLQRSFVLFLLISLDLAVRNCGPCMRSAERGAGTEISSDCVMALTACSDIQTKHCDSQSCTRPGQSAFIPSLLLLLLLSTSVFSLVLCRIKGLHHCTLVHSLKDEKNQEDICICRRICGEYCMVYKESFDKIRPCLLLEEKRYVRYLK